MTQPEIQRRPRSDGRRSRERILLAAAQLATVEGIDGLSIGRLADHIGMSKSGLFAHFGSKEELQLAAIGTAEEIFQADVLAPALGLPAGLPRLEALCHGFLDHVDRRVFPGGCFFSSVASETGTRPGPVRDRVTGVLEAWMALLAENIVAAQQQGDLDPAADPAQLAFELNAFLSLGNGLAVLEGGAGATGRARSAVAARLASARPQA